ncbi:(2Fe-2S)-binding protein [Bacillus halotolerans]|uniref:(2Fe-2S)-binding protein n=1 Tax=Bacillus halotolerans TaxID=260554 RepID=UPI00403F0575
MKKNLSLQINGQNISREVNIHQTLADFLRDDLELTGTHIGCDSVSCGACTILLNNLPVKSCAILALSCQNANVMTVESLSEDCTHPLQQSFKKNFALQCGFCTPGFLMMGLSLWQKGKEYSPKEIAEYLKGNLCRCTGYIPIIQAISEAIKGNTKIEEGESVGKSKL